MNQATWDDVEWLALNNPLVAVWHQRFRRGEISREQMLINCVVALAKAHETAILSELRRRQEEIEREALIDLRERWEKEFLLRRPRELRMLTTGDFAPSGMMTAAEARRREGLDDAASCESGAEGKAVASDDPSADDPAGDERQAALDFFFGSRP